MDYQGNMAIIDEAFKRNNLTTEDVLNLTIARKLCGLSDYSFAEAMSGGVTRVTKHSFI